MTPLCALALKHGTDKLTRHNYTPTYWELFKDRAREVDNVLEVGIKEGKSLRMWQEFFPFANIFGIDRDPYWVSVNMREPRIKCFIGDQANPPMLDNIAQRIEHRFDLIIDDGSHVPAHQLSTAVALLPYLADDGIYVIEDVKQNKKTKVEDPAQIASHLPKGFSSRLVRTGHHSDDVLILISHD